MSKARKLIDIVEARHYESGFEDLVNKFKLDDVGKEVLTAYSDLHPDELGPDARHFRNLHFRASKPVNGKEFVKLADEVIGEYNNFNKKTAEAVVKFFGADAEYTIAREGSACVYVSPHKAMKLELKKGHQNSQAKLFDADEFGLDTTNSYRIWWD